MNISERWGMSPAKFAHNRTQPRLAPFEFRQSAFRENGLMTNPTERQILEDEAVSSEGS
jgi:hypothetical protein